MKNQNESSTANVMDGHGKKYNEIRSEGRANSTDQDRVQLRERIKAKQKIRLENLTHQELRELRGRINANKRIRLANRTEEKREQDSESRIANKNRRLANYTAQELEERRVKSNEKKREDYAKKKANRPEGEEN